MSIYITNIARVSDHLILSSSTTSDNFSSNIKNEIEKVSKQISNQSSQHLSFPLPNGSIHASVVSPVFAICATSKEFNSDTAYDYLDKVIQEFMSEHGESVAAVERQHHFSDFYVTIDHLKTLYSKRAANSSMNNIQKDLSQIEESMANNLRSAIARDEIINEVGSLSENLGKNSGLFADKAKNLNRLHFWRTYGRPATIISIVGLVYFLVHFLL